VNSAQSIAAGGREKEGKMDAKFRKRTRWGLVFAATAAIAAFVIAPAGATSSGDRGQVVSPNTQSAPQQQIFLQYGHSADTSGSTVSSPSVRTFLSYGHAPDPSSAAVSTSSRSFLSTAHAPDTNDVGLATPVEVVSVPSADSFHWGDFGIGIGAAAALMLLLAAGILSVRVADHRLRSA
jgi:hypothetical protein